MSAFLERIGVFARAPDPRPLRAIEADIDDELAFHVEESTRALAEGGLDADAARAEALRRFGDRGRVRRECVRTQMGERLVLQRIQIVMTTVLVAAVGLLLWSNREARASMAAEREANAALLSRLEAQIALVGARAATERGTLADPRSLVTDDTIRRSIREGRASVADAIESPHAAAVDPSAPQLGDYAGPDGKRLEFGAACNAWNDEFQEQGASWRHGLKTAERLAALPGVQGVEILASVWHRLAVEHREQAMKPFVFDGGHPNVLEVLALGIRDDATSVRERAEIYLATYAFQDLLRGDGAAESWLAEWRDRPVDQVLRANATRWARELGALVAQYQQLPPNAGGRVLAVAPRVDLAPFAKWRVDLAGILEESGACALSEANLGLLDGEAPSQARTVLSWCRGK